MKITLIGLGILVAALALIAPLFGSDGLSLINVLVAAAGVVAAIVIALTGRKAQNSNGISSGGNISVSRGGSMETDGSTRAAKDVSVSGNSTLESGGELQAGGDITASSSIISAGKNPSSPSPNDDRS